VNIESVIQAITINAIPVLLAITLHEAAHAYAAKRFGDATAFMLGRMTLNPVKHIDPIGTIAMPLFLWFATSGSFLFGYAKPVPVNFNNLRNPKRDMIWVALAGPMSNFIQAFGWAVLLVLMQGFEVQEEFFLRMAQAGVLWNLVMFAFNLFPIPPLDGGRILVGVLPNAQANLVSRIEPFGFFIVMGLVIAGVISTLWMRPVMRLADGVLDVLLMPLIALFR
jgi:Zn-dependent protease